MGDLLARACGLEEWGVKNTAELISMVGRTVMVTGAASGIGYATALRFADAGADLLLVDINPEALGKAVDEIKALGRRAQGFVVDLADKAAIDQLWSTLDPLPDTLINNAGVYPMKDFLEIDEAFLAKTFKLNFESALWTCQHFIRRRQQLGGVIVNVSSVEAILPFKRDMVAYSASKTAILSLTRSLARDYGKQGFRANVIIPGAVKTPGTMSLMKKALTQVNVELMKTGYDFQSRLALGRWGQPDEVARVALFLASELASYVQGAMIPVDGGFLST